MIYLRRLIPVLFLIGLGTSVFADDLEPTLLFVLARTGATLTATGSPIVFPRGEVDSGFSSGTVDCIASRPDDADRAYAHVGFTMVSNSSTVLGQVFIPHRGWALRMRDSSGTDFTVFCSRRGEARPDITQMTTVTIAEFLEALASGTGGHPTLGFNYRDETAAPATSSTTVLPEPPAEVAAPPASPPVDVGSLLF